MTSGERKLSRLAFPRQSSEWDCLPKAFESALLAVFGWRRVPLRAVRAVYRHSIDLDDGTSRAAVGRVAAALACVPGVSARRLRGEGASPKGVLAELRRGAAVVIPTWVECDDGWYPHAVAVVAVEGRRARVADPYSSRGTALHTIGSGPYAMDRELFAPVAVERVAPVPE